MLRKKFQVQVNCNKCDLNLFSMKLCTIDKYCYRILTRTHQNSLPHNITSHMFEANRITFYLYLHQNCT